MKAIYTLWRHYTVRGAFLAIVAVGVWIVLLPLTSSFLHSSSILPLLLFTPTIAFGILSCINEAYLRATRAFHLAAIAVVVEALARFSLIWVFVIAKLPLAVLSVPALAMGIYVAFLLFLVIRFTPKDEHTIPLREFRFPWTFFSLTALTGLSSIAFFSLDTVLAVHFLTSEEAGMYGLLGVLGKIMFFAGSLTAGFILPFISREEGQGQDSRSTFERLFMLTAALVIGAQLLVGIAIPLASDLIGSPKIIAIRNLLPIYGLGIMMYTLAQTIVSYYLAKREYIVAFISVALALVQVTLLWLVHDTLTHFVVVMTGVGAINFILFGLFYHLYPKLRVPLKNLSDLVGLFQRLPSPSRRTVARGKYRILFFNWRDIRHSWAGGAEVYIHEIAKRLVLKGHDVTIFCGNDGKSERTEMIDGIRIIRRGGFYTVYIWAALYYILRLREQTDIVVDSENGIPFLTPLYVFKPIHLLIHHVHQDVLRAHLHFPFSEIAAFIEGDIMPFLYNRHHILTVSKSSKKDILDLGLGKEHSIGVVSPGIDLAHFKQCPKTENPSFVYIGRLKQYKNIDIAIKAFAKVVERFPKATFEIAGSGESEPFLKEIVHDLKLERSVKFRSFVSEREKVKLFGESWVAVQPSMVEGFGITVIEANACGTPVIASNVKGLRDSVMKDLTGVLVAPRDIKALADAMLALTTDRRLRERLSKSALKLSKDYGWDDSADRFLLQLEPTEEYQSSLGIAHTHAVEVGDNK